MTRTKTITANGKNYKLPEAFYFVGPGIAPGMYFWEFVRWGHPVAGEFYISGATPEVWRSHSDMTSGYIIVKPTVKAVQKSVWVPASG